MNDILAEACWVAFYLTAPALLVTRNFWPRILPRWGVLLLAGGLGGAAFYLSELLHWAEMAKLAQTFEVLGQAFPRPAEGVVQISGARLSDFMLGAVLELVYLLLWLVPYGAIQIVRDRRRQPTDAAA
jgi:hypothetical protein